MVVLIAGVAIAGLLLGGARRLRRAATVLAASAPSATDLGTVRRRFHLVVAGECITVALVIGILAGTGHQLWAPAAICAAVGLHFIPLARLFGVRLYYRTAAALCLVAAVTVILGATVASPSLWRVLPGFGAALALWATGATLLKTTEE